MHKDLQKAKDYTLRLLKYRLRSNKEIESRLQRKGFSREIINNTLDFFRDLGYLDDLTFAKAWVNSRLSLKPRSRKFLKYELKCKGVAIHIIEQVLSWLCEDAEYEIAEKLARRKAEKLQGLPELVQKRRLASYLARRGFSAQITYGLTKKILR